MKVQAIEKMYYQGRDRAPGEIYDMDDREETEVMILCHLGKIRRVTIKPEAPPMKFESAAVKPESEPETLAEEDTIGDKRRRYRRRDLKAEE